MTNNDKLFSEITLLVNQITIDELNLTAKRDRLRTLTRQWAGNEKPTEQPKPQKRRSRRASAEVNISAAVLALVNRQTGLTVPDIMDRLGFRDHEAAVRSALKKAKDVTVTSVDGRWYPISIPAKEEAPGVIPEPQHSANHPYDDGGRYIEPR